MPVGLRWVFHPISSFPLHGHAGKTTGWHSLYPLYQEEEHLLLNDSILIWTDVGAIEPVSFSLSVWTSFFTGLQGGRETIFTLSKKASHFIHCLSFLSSQFIPVRVLAQQNGALCTALHHTGHAHNSVIWILGVCIVQVNSIYHHYCI